MHQGRKLQILSNATNPVGFSNKRNSDLIRRFMSKVNGWGSLLMKKSDVREQNKKASNGNKRSKQTFARGNRMKQAFGS